MRHGGLEGSAVGGCPCDVADGDEVLGNGVEHRVAADASSVQSGGAERDGVAGVGVLAERVDRGEDGAQAVRVVGQERGGLVDRLLVEGNLAAHVGRCRRRSVGEAEAPANLGEWDVLRLAAGFSGEPILGGGGVLGVFERLRGRAALQGAQAKELGRGGR